MPLRNAATNSRSTLWYRFQTIPIVFGRYSDLCFSSISGLIPHEENSWLHHVTDNLLYLVKKIHLHLNLMKLKVDINYCYFLSSASRLFPIVSNNKIRFYNVLIPSYKYENCITKEKANAFLTRLFPIVTGRSWRISE